MATIDESMSLCRCSRGSQGASLGLASSRPAWTSSKTGQVGSERRVRSSRPPAAAGWPPPRAARARSSAPRGSSRPDSPPGSPARARGSARAARRRARRRRGARALAGFRGPSRRAFRSSRRSPSARPLRQPSLVRMEIRALTPAAWPAVEEIYAQGIRPGKRPSRRRRPRGRSSTQGGSPGTGSWRSRTTGRRLGRIFPDLGAALLLGVVEHSVYVRDDMRGRGVGRRCSAH